MNSEITRNGAVVPRMRFSQLFSSTRRGAHLARLLSVRQLVDWGWGRESEALATAALVVGELTANAALHGRVAGRGFRLTLTPHPDPWAPSRLRIAVSDCRGERAPARLAPATAQESGRGLLLVEALADCWGVMPRLPSGKTVWAECAVPVGTVAAGPEPQAPAERGAPRGPRVRRPRGGGGGRRG